MYVLLCRHARISGVTPELGALEPHAPTPNGACFGGGGGAPGGSGGSKCALERVQRSWLGMYITALKHNGIL